MTLKFDGWPWKTIGHLCQCYCELLHHFVAIGDSRSYSPETPNQNRRFLQPRDLAIWRVLKNNRHLFYATSALCIHSLVIQAWFTPETNRVKFMIKPCDLEIWWMTLQNNRAPENAWLQVCASFLDPSVNSNLSYRPEMPNLGQIQRYLEPLPWNLTDDLGKQ